MKKIILLLLCTYSFLNAEVVWTNYDKALKQSQQTKEIIMVMLGRDSCGVCNYMKTVVFKDKKVIKKMQGNFLPVYIELDFDDIPNNLAYIGTPTFYFLDHNEKTLLRVDGGKTTPSFLKALEQLR